MARMKKNKRENRVSKFLHNILYCSIIIFEISIVIKCIIYLFK